MTTTTDAPAVASTDRSPTLRRVSAVPYLPGLDGLRAVAIVAVMVYHADPSWLPGGFLGVEVFFVISGYLITLLLIGEHERYGSGAGRPVLRPAGPAAAAGAVHDARPADGVHRGVPPDALGQLRGDVIAGLTYVSNWYQIWVGQGYTASGDFAPLRHLWSLAVEEQFYLLWPLVMIVILRRGSRGSRTSAGRWSSPPWPSPPSSPCSTRQVRSARARSRPMRTGRSAGGASRRPTSCTCRRRRGPAACCSGPRWRWCGGRWR